MRLLASCVSPSTGPSPRGRWPSVIDGVRPIGPPLRRDVLLRPVIHMNRSGRRPSRNHRPGAEPMEGRLLLNRSTVPPVNFNHPYLHPLGVPLVRPNTPVRLTARPAIGIRASSTRPCISSTATTVIINNRAFVGPFVTLDARTGFIKIGNGSSVLDNAVIQSNPLGVKNPTTSVIIGDSVSIGFGATVFGPSTDRRLRHDSAVTQIGPNAVIDGATIMPGAIVGALAHVGPGVTVPTGFEVKPGANVTTNAEASDPALGKVIRTPTADFAAATQAVLNNQLLATGYTTLYQGSTATGVSPGVPTTVTGVNNGNLAQVEGSGPEPGSAAGPTFEPATAFIPTFLAPGAAAAGPALRLPRPGHRPGGLPPAGGSGRASPRVPQRHPRRPGPADLHRLDCSDRLRRLDQLPPDPQLDHRAQRPRPADDRPELPGRRPLGHPGAPRAST